MSATLNAALCEWHNLPQPDGTPPVCTPEQKAQQAGGCPAPSLDALLEAQRNADAIGAPERCEDGDARCEDWAAAGECDSNPTVVQPLCAKSCGTSLACGRALPVAVREQALAAGKTRRIVATGGDAEEGGGGAEWTGAVVENDDGGYRPTRFASSDDDGGRGADAARDGVNSALAEAAVGGTAVSEGSELHLNPLPLDGSRAAPNRAVSAASVGSGGASARPRRKSMREAMD